MSERESKRRQFDPYTEVRSLPSLQLEPLITSAEEEAIPSEYGHFIDGERYLIVFQMQGRAVRGAYTAVYSESETKKLNEIEQHVMHDNQRIYRFVAPELVYGLFPKLKDGKDKPAYIEIGNFIKQFERYVPVSVDVHPFVKTFSPSAKFDFIKVINIKNFRDSGNIDWAVQRAPLLNDAKLLIRDYVGGSKRRKRKTKRRRTRRR